MPDLGFPLVDAHFHQWDPFTTPRESSFVARPLRSVPGLYQKLGNALFPTAVRNFVGDPDIVLMPYMPADHARDWAGLHVDTVIHVEAAWTARGLLGPVGETRWVDGLDFGPGKRLGAIVAHADLRDPKVDQLLTAHLAASAKVRGIRQKASHHPSSSIMHYAKAPGLYRDPAFLRGFERLAQRKLCFEAWCYSHQLADVTALAARFPEVSIMIDHLGTPVAAAGPVGAVGHTESERDMIRGRWRDELARLAEHKHVFAKLSGFAMPVLGFGFHARPAPPMIDELTQALAPYLNHALDCFGVERCLFASNFPMDKPSAPLATLFGAYIVLATARGATAPRALLRENALRFYAIAAA